MLRTKSYLKQSSRIGFIFFVFLFQNVVSWICSYNLVSFIFVCIIKCILYRKYYRHYFSVVISTLTIIYCSTHINRKKIG